MTQLPKGPLLQCDTLSALAQELASANHYIGNDSGITHLAATLGLRTVALFKNTDPGIWAPLGEHVEVLNQSGLSPEQVIDQLIRS